MLINLTGKTREKRPEILKEHENPYKQTYTHTKSNNKQNKTS